MTKKYVGQRMTRTEDPRLLTGQALFVDDVQMPGMLHAAFLRSDYAHARLKSIDVSAAGSVRAWWLSIPPRIWATTWRPSPPNVSPPPGMPGVTFYSRTPVPLVKDKVRHAGEALAVVIAESRYIAEDAVEDIWADLEPLEAVVDLETALDPDAPLVHDDLESNLAAHLVQEKGDYEAARKQADLVVKRRIIIDRGAAGAMENRGIVAHWEPKSQHLTLWDTTQAPIPIRNGLAATVWSVGAPGAGDRALCRRWFWAQDHVVLSRGGPPHLGDAAIGQAHQVDRGPAGELFRHHPGTRPGPLC